MWSHELVTNSGSGFTIAEGIPASLPPESQEEPVFRDEMYAANLHVILLFWFGPPWCIS